MGNLDLEIVKKEIAYDDCTLLKAYDKLSKETQSRKNSFEKSFNNFEEYNYIKLTTRRLAYIFSKEECDSLLEEIKKRGLKTK